MNNLNIPEKYYKYISLGLFILVILLILYIRRIPELPASVGNEIRVINNFPVRNNISDLNMESIDTSIVHPASFK